MISNLRLAASISVPITLLLLLFHNILITFIKHFYTNKICTKSKFSIVKNKHMFDKVVSLFRSNDHCGCKLKKLETSDIRKYIFHKNVKKNIFSGNVIYP